MKNGSLEFEVFYAQVMQARYHILSRKLVREGFYPNRFPKYPPIDIANIIVGDRITVRAFFAVGESHRPKIDSGEMDLEVEFIENETMLLGKILTELPSHFPLAKGTSIELNIDEVLRAQKR